MTDVKCPYCQHEQEICHDDGYGYEEAEDCEQACTHCDKYFKFTTTITYSYDVKCQDGDHDMESMGGRFPHIYECAKCDHYERRAEIFDSVEAGGMKTKTDMSDAFEGMECITEIPNLENADFSGWDLSNIDPSLAKDAFDPDAIKKQADMKHTDFSQWGVGSCTTIEKMDLSGFDTSTCRPAHEVLGMTEAELNAIVEKRLKFNLACDRRERLSDFMLPIVIGVMAGCLTAVVILVALG